MLYNRLNNQLVQQVKDLLAQQDKTDTKLAELQDANQQILTQLKTQRNTDFLTAFLNDNTKIKENKKKRDEINEIYEFNIKFDGTPGEPALEFRDAVMNHDRFVMAHLPDEYSEVRIVIRIIKNLTGDAATLYNKRSGPKFSRLDQFFEWFDRTFKLHTLRQELFEKLKNWTIEPDTASLSIITKYKQTLQLFHQTTAVSSKDVIASTPLTDVIQVASINKAIELTKPKLYQFIDNYMMDFDRAAAPMNINVLERVIERGVRYLQTKTINSNKTFVDPTKLGSVNAVSIAQFPQFNNYNNNNKNSYNNQNSNNSNYNYRSNYDNYNNRYNNNNNNEINDNYMNNNNDKSYQNNYNYGSYQRGRGRGYNRGWNRGYRGRGRGRGRYRGRSRGRGNRNGRYVRNKPSYNDGYCTKCRHWGHYGRQCDWIHEAGYKNLLKEYNAKLPTGLPITLPSSHVNITQQKRDSENNKEKEQDNVNSNKFYDN